MPAGRRPSGVELAIRDPWDRLPGESDAAWEAFILFRDMGLSRSLPQVAQRLRKSRQLMHRWSARHDWNRRAATWDEAQDRVRTQEALDAQRDAVRQMFERHGQQLSAVVAALTQPAIAFLRRMQQPGAADELQSLNLLELLPLVRQSAALLPNVMAAERLARGLPLRLSGFVEDEDAGEQDDIARGLMEDPRAAELASELFARLAGSVG